MKSPIKKFYNNKEDIIKTIITSIFLSIGINLVTSYSEGANNIKLIIGILLITISIFLILIIGIGNIIYEEIIKGKILYKEKQFVEIPEYKVSVKTKCLYELYIKERPENKIGTLSKKEVISDCIIYQILDIISNCSNNGLKMKKIKPEKLEFNNIFLECFSNKDKRILKKKKKKNDQEQTVLQSNNKNGFYKNLNFNVPIGTKIVFNHNNLILKLPLFKVNIEVNVIDGRNFIDFNYMQMINIDVEPNHVIPFEVKITIKPTLLYILSIININNYKYYGWVDSFINDINHYMNEKLYYEKYKFEEITFWSKYFSKTNQN